MRRHLQQAASPAASRVTGHCCAGRGKGPRSWLVMRRGIQACLFCLSPPPPCATTRGRRSRQPLPGLCLLKPASVTPAGLRVDSEAGDLPSCGISWAVGSQAGVSAMVFGVFAFCCRTALVFWRRGPEAKGPVSSAHCSKEQGHPKLGGGGKRRSARNHYPPGGCVGSVCTCTSANQHDISSLSPLPLEKLPPEPVCILPSIILVILTCLQQKTRWQGQR